MASRQCGKRKVWLIGALLALSAVLAAFGLFRARHGLADGWRRAWVARIPAPLALPAGEEEAGEAPAAQDETGDAVPVSAPAADSADSEAVHVQEVVPEAPAAWPPRVSLPVPMFFQSPDSSWNAIHEDACEEASMYMIRGFLEGRSAYSRAEMEELIQAVVAYQVSRFGYFESTSAEQVAATMRDFLGIAGAQVVPVGSADDIRRELAAGRPVILPADGRLIGNPNFRNGGPAYHMFVVKGYTETHFIANDPGTRRGESWLYAEAVVMAALGDWLPDEGRVDAGRKVMVVVR